GVLGDGHQLYMRVSHLDQIGNELMRQIMVGDLTRRAGWPPRPRMNLIDQRWRVLDPPIRALGEPALIAPDIPAQVKDARGVARPRLGPEGKRVCLVRAIVAIP